MTGRRAVFAASLEQSEQLFKAARAADDGIRPMLLFYGLSQATRAVAAAAMKLDEGWRPTAHGLSCSGEPQRPPDIADLTVKPSEPTRSATKKEMDPADGGGAFGILQTVLSSETWPRSATVTLGALLAAHPSLEGFPGREEEWPAMSYTGETRDVLENWEEPVSVFQILLAPAAGDRAWTRYTEMPDHYQMLATASIAPRPPTGGGDPLQLDATFPEGNRPMMHRRTTVERHWMTPDLGGTRGNQPRLVLYWAIAYALSMRARYDPEGWTRDLNPDGPRYAELLRTVLQQILNECPGLINQAIRFVSQEGPVRDVEDDPRR